MFRRLLSQRITFDWLFSRRGLKWGGTIACAVILVCEGASLRWKYIAASNSDLWIGIQGGSLMWEVHASPPFAPSLRSWHLKIGGVFADWNERCEWWWRGVRPDGYVSASYSEHSVPLWIPFLLIGIPTALLWLVGPRRPTPGYCFRCNYNLTGNTSGICPECGTPIAAGPGSTP